jgi:hypothetical protein
VRLSFGSIRPRSFGGKLGFALNLVQRKAKWSQMQVKTVTTKIPAGSNFEIIFPHTSVMVIRLERKSDNGL